MRARNIKPGFFTNELLVELHPLTRLLYAGLWCMADRRGLVEDRPKRIKIEILPCDNHDIDAALGELEAAGLISRYTGINGHKAIKILKFLTHQRPHHSEPANKKLDEPGEVASSTREVASPPALNPESGILNPESGILKEESGSGQAPSGKIADRGRPATKRQTDFATRLLAKAGSSLDAWLIDNGYDQLLDDHIDTIRSLYGGNTQAVSGAEARAQRTREAGERVLQEIREGKFGKRN